MFIELHKFYQIKQMILRLTIFISLLTLFYFYCNEDGTINNYRETNDINMIEMPVEQSPTLKYESIPQATLITDSSYYSVFLPYSNLELSVKTLNFLPKIIN